ncbi:hypothetical protein BGZ75_001194, partial [Mortierella antarctica]
MLGLVSSSSGADALGVVRAALPIGIGLASAAFLSLKVTGMIGNGLDKSIPTAALRPGDKTHDAEYSEDPDLFLSTCEELYGPVFNIFIYNQFITMISGPLAREVFMTENLNFGDAADDTSGIHSFTASITSSKRAFNDPAIHEMIRDIITPNLALFTPRIVKDMLTIVDKEFDIDDRKLIANPLLIFQEMIASANFLAKGPLKSVWRTLRARTTYGILSPLQQH